MQMKVAVWDTYVKKQSGDVLHFDIVVPAEQEDEKVIYSFGKKYLASVGEPTAPVSLKECRLCHIEEPSQEMIDTIQKEGYYILEMEQIPARLPENPSRRDMILYLRGHFEDHRFADFKGKSREDVQALLRTALGT